MGVFEGAVFVPAPSARSGRLSLTDRVERGREAAPLRAEPANGGRRRETRRMTEGRVTKPRLARNLFRAKLLPYFRFETAVYRGWAVIQPQRMAGLADDI